MIRKLASGEYRLYSRKVNPKTGRRAISATFSSRAAAEKHERAVPVLQAFEVEDGQQKATRGCAAQHQEGGKSGTKEAHDFAPSEGNS